jgi:SAM-dependent methyltransferase
MEKITNWSALWDELVAVQRHSPRQPLKTPEERADPWHKRASEFDEMSKRRATEPDLLKDFVASRLDASTTVLDIGAGTGAWVLRLAPLVASMTALDPSAAMLAILQQNVEEAGLSNVRVVPGAWPEAEVETHDVSLCAHAVYASPNLPRFVERMMAATRQTCYLIIRAPRPDGLMAAAARRVWGQPYDSPSFIVAYNILLQMGLYPNVLFDAKTWPPWSHLSPEEALSDLKRRLALGEGPSEHDEYLEALLRSNLEQREGRYYWPESACSALIYWDIG